MEKGSTLLEVYHFVTVTRKWKASQILSEVKHDWIKESDKFMTSLLSTAVEVQLNPNNTNKTKSLP